MDNNRNVLGKLYQDAQLRVRELEILIKAIEEESFGFDTMFENLINYKETKGQLIEAKNNLNKLERLIRQWEAYNCIVLDSEVPF